MRMQKIVIKVQMNSERSRIKIMKIIAEEHGVTSMTIVLPDRDRVVVIGNGIDSVKLTASLRRNVGDASIESVQNMNDNDTKNDEDDTSSSYNYNTSTTTTGYPQPYPHRPVYYYNVVEDPYRSSCSIM